MSRVLKRGFTIIELIIVLSLLAFLALIVIGGFRSQIFKGKDAKRKADIKRVQIAVEEYEKDRDCYPLSSAIACKPGTGLNPYLDKVPCDPETGASYFYEHEDSTCPSWYKIYTNLENETDPDISKKGCAAGCGPASAFNYYASSPNAPTTGGTGGTGGTGDTGGTGTGGDTGGGGSTGDPETGYYGCRGGVCVPISWNPARPGPECDPNYQNPTCYGQCAEPMNQCESWQ